MTHWYVKQLSELTKISVQTLHHYDRIDLLKPSVRLANGYRLYSEKDLSKLQQIIALKFFGFELAQIKLILSKEMDLLNNIEEQSRLLFEKGQIFLQASKALQNVIAKCQQDKSVHWDKTIELIEVYHMTTELEKSWAGKTFNQEELQEYATFEQNIKTRLNSVERQKINDEWDQLVQAAKDNQHTDPTGPMGIVIGKRCMDWVKKLYGPNFMNVASNVWEKGFKTGRISEEYPITPEVVSWLDKAMTAYHHDCAFKILGDIGKVPDKEVQKNFANLLTGIFGDNEAEKAAAIQAFSSHLSPEVAKWLANHFS